MPLIIKAAVSQVPSLTALYNPTKRHTAHATPTFSVFAKVPKDASGYGLAKDMSSAKARPKYVESLLY